MAKQTPILRKSFPADSAVGANLVVVMSGTNAGNVALPAAALATGVIGVTAAPADGNNYVSVDLGVGAVVQCVSDGSAVITAGDFVAVANSSGQVKTVVPADGTNIRQVVGKAIGSIAATAGLLVDVIFQPQLYSGA